MTKCVAPDHLFLVHAVCVSNVRQLFAAEFAFVCVCLYMPCGHLLGKGWPPGSRLWCLTVSLSLSHWYPGSGVVLDCIDSWSLHPYLLFLVDDCCFVSYLQHSLSVIQFTPQRKETPLTLTAMPHRLITTRFTGRRMFHTAYSDKMVAILTSSTSPETRLGVMCATLRIWQLDQ